MTLVELLVVVTILGVLAVAVLPTLAETTESRRTREAARVASSFMARAQSRSLSRREWSGFNIIAAATGNIALDMTLVDVPPSYRGDVVPARVTMSTAGNATVPSGVIAQPVASALAAGDGKLVRFGGRDPWFSVVSVSPSLITFARRGSLAQQYTTPWPPMNEPLDFEITSAPAPYGTITVLGESRVFDTMWSGFDDAGAFARFNAGTVSVLYDGTGGVRRLIYPGSAGMVTRDSPGAIFFLIGRADRAGQADPTTFKAADDTTGCNWQYADSVWIMINPTTGSVYQATCAAAGAGTESHLNSQSFVRAYLSTGGGS